MSSQKERVEEVAKSLLALHLAPNIEEARKRAKEIIAQAGGRTLLKDINEESLDKNIQAKNLLKSSEKARKSLGKTAKAEEKDAEKSISSAKKTKAKVKSVKDAVKYDLKVHGLEKGDVKEAMREVDEIACAADDAKFIVNTADKVQKKKK